MRIESVVIKNINSLAGTFEVDFTDNRYSEGLFAIVGPSGAGKTTVLDAVCLALYGKTPRIETISETQDEIMSKNCGDCAAEAVFVSRGKRYKATFSHERGRGEKPFRQVKREIWEYDAAAGKWSVIASMIKDAKDKIEEITGLTFERFTRSIMLAQFRFAEFLKADSNERAAILEQISDMGIYRDISAAVYERAKRERKALDEITVKAQSLKVLDEGQSKAYGQQAVDLAESVTQLNKLRERLEACRSAAGNISKYREELTGYQNSEPALAQTFSEQTKLYEQAVREENETRAALDALQKTLKAVREFDGSIAAQNRDIARLSDEISQNDEKISVQKKGILGVFKKYVPGASGEEFRRLYETEDIGGILRAGAAAEYDAAAAAEKRIQGEINAALQGKDEAYWHKRADVLKAYVPVAEARETAKQAQDRLTGQSKKHEELKKELSVLEAQEKVIDEKLVYARLEEKFGEERRKLIDGKPCPLCGATEHPHMHKPFDSAFLEDVKKQKEDILKHVREAQRDLAASGGLIAELEQTIKEKTQFIQQKEQEFGGGDIDCEMSAEQAAAELAAAENVTRRYTALLSKLNAAKDNITGMTAKLGGVDKDVALVGAAKQAIAEYMKQTAEKQKQMEAAAKLSAEYRDKRLALFGENDADEEEEKAKTRSQDALKEKDTRREHMENAGRACEQNKKDIARTQERIKSESRVLDVTYADARISVLEAKERPCPPDEGIKALFGSFVEAAERLTENAAENSDKFADLIDITGRLSSGETARQGAVRQMLSDNEQSLRSLCELKENAKKQEQTCVKWDRLDALIGSANGIKFSRMAQGYTFEVLLKYANSCLKKMTDQYILVRDTGNAAKPLELAIMDNYQAGIIRPVSNLSGGESFLVSLALALGMSEMSSGRTRIDSLFIDEGFASLDDDYLEAALQTLSSLGNREGKLVGVISHVAALKERIDTQIEVKKLSGGRSTISGPGVSAAGE